MEFFDKVCVILSELSGKESISLEDELQSDLGLDSLHMVTLLIMLEENFQITLDESDMNPFDLDNVSHVVDLVEKYAGGENNEENEKEEFVTDNEKEIIEDSLKKQNVKKMLKLGGFHEKISNFPTYFSHTFQWMLNH